MPQKHPTLWHVREQHGITRELIDRFKKKAIGAGQNPTAVLAALLRRYLDGDKDAGTEPTTSETSQPVP